MKSPFAKRRKMITAKRIKASSFFIKSSHKEKDKLFNKVLKEVNREQREMVEKYGEASV